MGVAQSTRKITLVDDDKAGVIKLSESLAHRLRGQLEGQQAAAAVAQKASPADTQEPLHIPPPPQAPLPPPPVPEASLLPPPPPQTPLPPPPPSFIEKPLPIAPKIPDVVPLPEPPKVPVAPKVPELVPIPVVVPEPVVPIPVVVPEPVIVELPGEVTSEPLVPEPLLPSVALPKPPTSAGPVSVEEAIVAAPVPVPSSPAEPSAAPDVGVAIKAGPSPTLAQPAGSIPPWSIYAEEAHLMVMRLREEKEQEIKKLNLEWRDKIDTRENEFVNMARLSEEQVSSALKEVESLFMKASCSPVCQNHQDAVQSCYQDHPRQSLRCNREVEQFTQCVDLSRLQSIMKQEAH